MQSTAVAQTHSSCCPLSCQQLRMRRPAPLHPAICSSAAPQALRARAGGLLNCGTDPRSRHPCVRSTAGRRSTSAAAGAAAGAGTDEDNEVIRRRPLPQRPCRMPGPLAVPSCYRNPAWMVVGVNRRPARALRQLQASAHCCPSCAPCHPAGIQSGHPVRLLS